MGDYVRRIGQYEIVAHLKSGGMANLYLGRRKGAAGFARHVAVKVIHPHLAKDQQFVRMFQDEAVLTERIRHPNVVHVESFDQEDGTYYLAMEYVHGCSLSALMRSLAQRERRLAPELAAFIAIQIADGLHAAHETRGDDGALLQVVHRDVSPQNVLLSYGGHVKIIDFGIAKAQSRAYQTTTRSLKGKIRYMAPEQAFGRPVDRRTDVYALGIVLWEMLTMHRMFDATDDFALLDQVRMPTPRAPSELVDGMPPALDAAVLRALAPNADDRPASMQEFRRLLAEATPGAMTLDAQNLADLLAVVMVEEIEKQKTVLPESMSGVQAMGDVTRDLRPSASAHNQVHTAPEIVLKTLTWNAPGVSLGEDEATPPPDATPPAVAPTLASAVTRAPQQSESSTWKFVVAAAGIIVFATATAVGIAVVGPWAGATQAAQTPELTGTRVDVGGGTTGPQGNGLGATQVVVAREPTTGTPPITRIFVDAGAPDATALASGEPRGGATTKIRRPPHGSGSETPPSGVDTTMGGSPDTTMVDTTMVDTTMTTRPGQPPIIDDEF